MYNKNIIKLILINSYIISNSFNILLIFYVCCSCMQITAEIQADPKFSFPITNVTVPVGREALLTCVVQDLGTYKVAWLRVDTQTILTIQNHVITKNHRVGITYSEHKTWQLKIKDIKETDRGWYMCQINTDPMKSQVGYLDVVVPPDILDYPTSTDMVVREGSNVTIKCAAIGSPDPTVIWKREGGELIELPNGNFVSSAEGSNLIIPRVKRQHMGAYLCIASNGVPPSVSKRIILIVHFPPMITVQNQLIGAIEGTRILLECQSEAFPKSINYWTRERGEIVPPGGRYFSNVSEDGDYRVTMKLFINPLTQTEFGSYKCVAKNSLGDTDGTIKLYRIPANAMNSVDAHEGRGKGKKRQKNVSEIFHQAKSIDATEDFEYSGKRKDVIRGGIENEDSFYDASSSANSHSDLYYKNYSFNINKYIKLSMNYIFGIFLTILSTTKFL